MNCITDYTVDMCRKHGKCQNCKIVIVQGRQLLSFQKVIKDYKLTAIIINSHYCRHLLSFTTQLHIYFQHTFYLYWEIPHAFSYAYSIYNEHSLNRVIQLTISINLYQCFPVPPFLVLTKFTVALLTQLLKPRLLLSSLRDRQICILFHFKNSVQESSCKIS